MITISLCMIVKNEEKILSRCLDTLKHLMDEIIIVDTGSTDKTKEIARKYTDKFYDFDWCDDFAAARNFSFSKATMEYIYAPDADEVLNEENQVRFLKLKENMISDIEIVTMHYLTPSKYNTVQNMSEDIRPKLFKRLRTFTWINPVHETIRTEPLVFDSDIEIQHLPAGFHGKRDFSIFLSSYKKNGSLPDNIVTMYAKELLKCGTKEDIANAAPIFEEIHSKNPNEESTCILARYYRQNNQTDKFFSVALKNVAIKSCSEVCCELADYYYSKGEFEEASIWYYNAAYEVSPVLDVETGGVIPLNGLSNSYEQWAKQISKQLDSLPVHLRKNFVEDQEKIRLLTENAKEYAKRAKEWVLPNF